MRSRTGWRTRSARFIPNHDTFIEYENGRGLPVGFSPLADIGVNPSAPRRDRARAGRLFAGGPLQARATSGGGQQVGMGPGDRLGRNDRTNRVPVGRAQAKLAIGRRHRL